MTDQATAECDDSHYITITVPRSIETWKPAEQIEYLKSAHQLAVAERDRFASADRPLIRPQWTQPVLHADLSVIDLMLRVTFNTTFEPQIIANFLREAPPQEVTAAEKVAEMIEAALVAYKAKLSAA